MTTQAPESGQPIKGGSQARPYEIVFCKRVPKAPEPGEIIVLSADRNDPSARRRSLHVLEHGLAALPQGTGPIRRIVVPMDPTLDDMLAATFCSRLLAGEPLPAGARALAEYAESARAGLCDLAKLPPAATIEGIFMAVRNISGEDLSKPRAASEFVIDWWRMSDRLMQAAEEDASQLCEKRLFDGPSFADERTYLARDHQKFLQEVAAGEIWNIQLPGQAANGRALVLRHPMSLLFKYFSRSDTDSPGGRAFDLLAVQWGPSEWVFSTDPTRRISLLGLHEKLQAAELARDPARAASNPWFDGGNFQHSQNTLVASPEGSSLLADHEIERISRGWCKGRRQLRFSGKQKVSTAVVAALLVLGAVLWWGLPAAPRMDRALLITLKYDGPAGASADAPLNDATAIGEILQKAYGFHVTEKFNVTGDGLEKAIDEIAQIKYQPSDQLLVYVGGCIDGPGDAKRPDAKTPSKQEDGAEDAQANAALTKMKSRLGRLEACRHVLLILDNCDNGGTALPAEPDDPPAVDNPAPGDSAHAWPSNERLSFIKQKLTPRTRRYLTSFGKASKSKDGRFYSPLAAVLLKVLQTGGGDRRVLTVDQLEAAVEKTGIPGSAGTFADSNQDGGTFIFADDGS